MSYSKLIHDYLDGELTTSQQDLLFSELANNVELRQEFNQQVRLQTLAQNDLNSISPPTDAANAVFAQLGFSIPNAGFSGKFFNSKPAPSGVFWKSTIDFLKRNFPTFLTSVISTTITALIFLYFFNNNSSLNYSNLDGSGRNVASSYISQLNSKNDFNPIAENSVTRNLSDAEFERLFSKALADYFAQNPLTNNVILTPGRSIFDISDKSTPIENKNFTELNKENINQNNYQNLFPLAIQPNSTKTETKSSLTAPETISNISNEEFSLALRSFSSQSAIKTNVPSNANPWFNNMALSLAYNLNKYHSFGVEVGQEPFAQKFQKTEFDLTSTYEQNPLLFWYGGYYRFSYPDFIFNEKLFPFAQIFGGATSIGPLIKSQIGFQFKPDKRVTFVLGGEFSRLIYSLQNNVYNSDKFGITYGISIQY
jgi:hypothetical protein